MNQKTFDKIPRYELDRVVHSMAEIYRHLKKNPELKEVVESTGMTLELLKKSTEELNPCVSCTSYEWCLKGRGPCLQCFAYSEYKEAEKSGEEKT